MTASAVSILLPATLPDLSARAERAEQELLVNRYLAESIAYSAYLACNADDEKLAFEEFLIASNRALLGA